MIVELIKGKKFAHPIVVAAISGVLISLYIVVAIPINALVERPNMNKLAHRRIFLVLILKKKKPKDDITDTIDPTKIRYFLVRKYSDISANTGAPIMLEKVSISIIYPAFSFVVSKTETM